jgi:hypothetical protein
LKINFKANSKLPLAHKINGCDREAKSLAHFSSRIKERLFSRELHSNKLANSGILQDGAKNKDARRKNSAPGSIAYGSELLCAARKAAAQRDF